MHIACSFAGGAGHLFPQLPLLRAFERAGHQLTLIGRASGVQVAPREIFQRIVEVPDSRSSVSDTIAPLVPLDLEAERAVVVRHFAGNAARQSASRLDNELADTDLIVCDELDFGAMAQGALKGIPVAVVAVIASGSLVIPDKVTPALKQLQRELDAKTPISFRGDRFVIPFAPVMRDPDSPELDNELWMRPDVGPESAPDGSIIATLGTEFNTESGDLFDRIIGALSTLGQPAVLAIGSDLEPHRFGEVPHHVAVVKFADLAELIPRASLVIHHGGSGLFTKSILGGTPQLVLPMGADQPFTADRIEALNIGAVLDAGSATSTEIAAKASMLLIDAEMRNRVTEIRAELLRLPEPESVVRELESLVGQAFRARAT